MTSVMERTLPQPPHRTVTRVGKPRGALGVALFVLPHTLIGLGLLGMVLTRVVVLLFGTNVTGLVWEATRKPIKNGHEHKLVWTFERGTETHHQEDHVSLDVYNRVLEAAPAGRQPQALKVPVTARALGSTALLTGDYGSPWLKTLMFLLVALFWNSIVAVFQWTSVGVRLWDRWLLRHGLAVHARVVAVESGNRNQAAVRYRFQHPTLHCEVENKVSGVAGLVALEKDAAVVALVHPGRPWSTLLEVTGYRMDGAGQGGVHTPTALRG
jgi:hypothetical protein